MSDKFLEEKITELNTRVKHIERMIQLWLRTNHGTLLGKKPQVDGCIVQLSEEERQELIDLVYGNSKK